MEDNQHQCNNKEEHNCNAKEWDQCNPPPHTEQVQPNTKG